MKKELIKKINNFTLYDVQSLIAYITVIIYMFAYLIAFEIFNTFECNTMEDDGFSMWFLMQAFYMGKAFSISIISVCILRMKKKIIACIIASLNVIFQGAYLYKIAYIIIMFIKPYTLKTNNELGVEYCNDEIAFVVFISIFLVMMLTVNVFIMVQIIKKHLPKLVSKKKDKKNAFTIILQILNLFAIFGVWWLNLSYSLTAAQNKITDLVNGTSTLFDVWWRYGFWGLVLPFSLFLIIIMGKLIKKEYIIFIIGFYILFMVSVKNVVFHIFSFNLFANGDGLYTIYDKYKGFMMLVIGVASICGILKVFTRKSQ